MRESLVPNITDTINRFVDYLKDDKLLGLFLTRWVAGLIDYLLDFMEGLLLTGEDSLGLGPAVSGGIPAQECGMMSRLKRA